MNPPSRVIQDAYEILEEIGQGGMARVYRARQLSLNRIVALKEIKPAFAANPELLERFKREARTAANLVHENIVSVLNFGEPARGSLFIVLEFMDGRDLKTLLRAAGPLPPRIAAILVREAARALAYAHGKKLVHRDVKPGNVMVSDRGEVKLMDFGIVREMDSDLTRTGAFLGTPSYMSPEQFLGDEITAASDVFSLGVVLFELLTGEKPFKADSEASLSKKVRTEREPKIRGLNSQVPRRLANAAHNCMKKDPHKRSTTERLVLDLEKFLGTRSREKERNEVAAWIRETLRPADSEISAVPIAQRRGPEVDSLPPQPAPRSAPEIIARRSEAEIIPARRPEPESARRPEIIISEKMGERASAPSVSEVSEPPRIERPSRSSRDEVSEQSGIKAMRPRERARQDLPTPGEWLMKWLWRFILLAIVALSAVAIFMIFNPDGLSGQGGFDPGRLLDLFKH